MAGIAGDPPGGAAARLSSVASLEPPSANSPPWPGPAAMSSSTLRLCALPYRRDAGRVLLGRPPRSRLVVAETLDGFPAGSSSAVSAGFVAEMLDGVVVGGASRARREAGLELARREATARRHVLLGLELEMGCRQGLALSGAVDRCEGAGRRTPPVAPWPTLDTLADPRYEVASGIGPHNPIPRGHPGYPPPRTWCKLLIGRLGRCVRVFAAHVPCGLDEASIARRKPNASSASAPPVRLAFGCARQGSTPAATQT